MAQHLLWISKPFPSLLHHCDCTRTAMLFSDMLDMPDVPGPLVPTSIDNCSSFFPSTASSPTNFFDGCLLSPASILPGSMTTLGTSTGLEGCETSTYIQLFCQYQQWEQELSITKQELEPLKYVSSSLIFSSTPHIVCRWTHNKLVEGHALLMAMYIKFTKSPCVEDCYRPWECKAAIDCRASCKSWLTRAMGTVFVLEQQDRPALR